jgi:hypothetical protein
MEQLQELIEKTLNEIPRFLLERRLAEKAKIAGLAVDEATLSRMAADVLNGSGGTYNLGASDEKIVIRITDEDIEIIENAAERFHKEQLANVLTKIGGDTADLLYKELLRRWPEMSKLHQADMEAFKGRLEGRWGKALAKLRMLLAIVVEWSSGVYERRHKAAAGRTLSHLDDVMLRLHIRACQVTNEIIILLENGYADGAMARWRTLHEITTVAAVIAKFGDEIAERYVYYQIVESTKALTAYEQNHRALGFRPASKAMSTKVRSDYAKALKRFGKEFGGEYGWAANHLKTRHVTFARLEEEAGAAMMRSPYKMASYNVHAGPKGLYFKLGNLEGSHALLAGASNAGLTDPAQHAAVSLVAVTLLTMGDTPIFDDIIVGKIAARLQDEILSELGNADRKLRRDDRRQRSVPGPTATHRGRPRQHDKI